MLSTTFGAAVYGVNAALITVEVSVIKGIGLNVVGLPDVAVKESLQRIDAALKNGGYEQSRYKTIINLAPADIRKEGSSYDLPIALCLIACSGKVEFERNFSDYVILGELSLDGKLRPIKGVLPIAIEARANKLKGFILPKENASEASIVNNLEVIGVETLQEAVDFLAGTIDIKPTVTDTRDIFYHTITEYEADFSHVQGQENIKRALEIAAAGGHNAIMIGPPGAGKTMLAKRLPSILPPMTLIEALETTKIHSVAGKLGTSATLIARRPFRNPHHTISDAALVGGGSVKYKSRRENTKADANPLNDHDSFSEDPGELFLAHNGVVYFEDLPEFKSSTLELIDNLRRSDVTSTKTDGGFPSDFAMIASMNPCPCGYYTYSEKVCKCSPEIIDEYLGNISDVFLDSCDIHVKFPDKDLLQNTTDVKYSDSATIRERVIKAREIQTKRFENFPHIYSNAMMDSSAADEFCWIAGPGRILMQRAVERNGLSGKDTLHILKVARTIADLDDGQAIQFVHVAEAVGYRQLGRR